MGDPPVSDTLLTWCRDHEIGIDGIAAAYFSIGDVKLRGVVASKELSPCQCIVSVPRRSLFTTDVSRQSDVLASSSLCPLTLLAATLLYECSKGRESPWWGYLSSFPSSYSTLACFTSEDVKALQCTYAIRVAQTAIEDAQTEYKAALPTLRHLGIAPKWKSMQAWQWAVSSISSRTMYLPWCPAGALTPFGDLHNHKSPPPPYTLVNRYQHQEEESAYLCGDGRYEEETGEYKIYARREHQAGEQVYLCYGRHSNLTLLHHYGFSLPDNTHDVAILPIESFTCSLHDALNKANSPEEILIHYDGSPSWELLRCLRLALSSVGERNAKAYLALEDQPISNASEARVWQELSNACRSALTRLATTIHQDEELLLSRELTDTRRAAIEWRLGYKCILERCIKLCDVYQDYV